MNANDILQNPVFRAVRNSYFADEPFFPDPAQAAQSQEINDLVIKGVVSPMSAVRGGYTLSVRGLYISDKKAQEMPEAMARAEALPEAIELVLGVADASFKKALILICPAAAMRLAKDADKSVRMTAARYGGEFARMLLLDDPDPEVSDAAMNK